MVREGGWLMKEKARPAGKLIKPARACFFDSFCSDFVKKHALFMIPAKMRHLGNHGSPRKTRVEAKPIRLAAVMMYPAVGK